MDLEVKEYNQLENGTVLLEDFESDEVGKLPWAWLNMNGSDRPATYNDENQADYQYRVRKENGNQFLRFEGREAKHLNLPLGKSEIIDIYETPILSWKWRVFELPEDGREDKDDRNDVAASVYVVFDLDNVFFKEVPRSIRYTWSSNLEPGTVKTAFFGKQKIVVLEQGDAETGTWKTFQRNIVEDFQRLFGEAPPHVPISLLILSDGDSTDSFVKADYDDFVLKPL